MLKLWCKYRYLRILSIVALVLLVLVILFNRSTRPSTPPGDLELSEIPERIMVDTNALVCGNSWLRLGENGLWEMYLEGNDLELGIYHGNLARELIHYQEEVFVNRLQEMVPSRFYLGFLKQVVRWMNRKMDRHVPRDLQREIFGVAGFASHDYGFIGDPYTRILGYHAAHDLGHALQNMNLVACTALGLQGEHTSDGELLAGRNFDFHMGEDFARNKILAFYRPDDGLAFASLTWASMCGVVSGMNEAGLALTLNAAKTGMPGSSKMPVSLLARRILQQATNIEEALDIAMEAETFVAESFFISSARDSCHAVIEKSPRGCSLYRPDENMLVLTNHFQSDFFRDSKLTLQNKAEGASLYRWERTRELALAADSVSPAELAALLRDRGGKAGADIGMGNEKSVNQLIAHHAVIFRPGELKMWVSASPYQLGGFTCYDLGRIFSTTPDIGDVITIKEEYIPADPFLYSGQYHDFLRYRKLTEAYRLVLESGEGEIPEADDIEDYLSLNPLYYHCSFMAAELYRASGNFHRAEELYRQSLEMEIPRLVDREQVEKALESLTKHQKSKK